MPLGDFEREVLRLLAVNRNPDSFVAGASVLHQTADSPRSSRDVDVFHDTKESLANSSAHDTQVLKAAGYAVESFQLQETFHRAFVARGGLKTKVEWVYDSAFRFFPVETDIDLGWRINFWDAATNKVLAFFGRAEIRDYLDCIYLHQCHLPLGALIWAAAGKDGGLSPEMILDWARRSTRFHEDDLLDLRLSKPVDLKTLKVTWLQACAEAEVLFERLPPSESGCLYLDSQGRPVLPDPNSDGFQKLTRHFGSIKGAVPRIVQGA